LIVPSLIYNACERIDKLNSKTVWVFNFRVENTSHHSIGGHCFRYDIQLTYIQQGCTHYNLKFNLRQGPNFDLYRIIAAVKAKYINLLNASLVKLTHCYMYMHESNYNIECTFVLK